nr:pyroglutamylated RFamide peptide receptor-like [Crassostrea virginica]
MGEFLCIFTHYIQTVSMVCSVMTLTAMSVERYIVIVYPLRARSVCTVRHAKLVITMVWILAFVFSTPVLYIQNLMEVGQWRKAHWCVKWSRPTAHGVLFEIYMFFILFVVPITVMIITYSRVSCEIWNGAAIRAELSGRKVNETICLRLTKFSGDRRTLLRGRGGKQPTTSMRIIPDDGKTRKQVVVMLMVIVAFFIICWGPILFNNLLVALNVLDNYNTGYLKPMRMAFHLLSYLNSCVNPVVYGVMSHNFRDRLRRIVTRKLTRNQSLTATTAILSRNSTLRNHHQTDERGSKEGATLKETQ